jgi:hypothetical protein
MQSRENNYGHIGKCLRCIGREASASAFPREAWERSNLTEHILECGDSSPLSSPGINSRRKQDKAAMNRRTPNKEETCEVNQ